jgi:predicted dehydrogenase
MKQSNQSASRRTFLKNFSKGVAGAALVPSIATATQPHSTFQPLRRLSQSFSPNDHIQLAIIGYGGMGTADTNTALQVPGTRLVAACDLYDGRLKEARQAHGQDLFTTRDYREILERKDVDAVIIATPDHWHKDISVEALRKGKAVYVEKPMVHDISEGAAMIEAQEKFKGILQVGSQGMSSLGNEKAKELYEAGAIGQLNYAEGFWARNSPFGAWQYDIPADASEKTVDWKAFLNKLPYRPFDAKRFFRWRCYRDYGTGVSGDLFVHLFSSLHFIVSSKGPNRIMATGGLRYWKDGREVPDVLLGMFDYPETKTHPAFNLSLRVNFVDGTADSTYLRLVGSEGSMNVQWDKVTLTRSRSYDPVDDPLAGTKAKQNGESIVYERKKILPPSQTIYGVEQGYKGPHFDHFYNLFMAMRGGAPTKEDSSFGFRAAAPALLCNDSYFKSEIIYWDPEKLKLIK